MSAELMLGALWYAPGEVLVMSGGPQGSGPGTPSDRSGCFLRSPPGTKSIPWRSPLAPHTLRLCTDQR